MRPARASVAVESDRAGQLRVSGTLAQRREVFLKDRQTIFKKLKVLLGNTSIATPSL